MINGTFEFLLKNKVFTIFFAVLCFLLPQQTIAATLSLSPASSNLSVGNIVSMRVLVDTQGKWINNAEAIIQFPTDLLEVISVTKNPSIFSLWVEEPSFSNFTGKITFNGGIANPGFNGASGSIASITFKAKKSGNASIIFAESALRENDGLGTDILTSRNVGLIQITAPPPTEALPASPNIPIATDTTPPEQFTPTTRLYDNRHLIKLNAKDSGSGIGYYTILIDSEPVITVEKEELIDNEYTLPYLYPGRHNLTVTAYDKAGNRRDATLTIVSPSISVPIISLSRSEIINGETVIISGTTDYPGKRVVVILELDGKEFKKYTQTISEDGSFSITTEAIKKTGLINIWAENILSDKVKSQPSQKFYLKVDETKFVKMTTVVLGLIVLSGLLIALLFLLYLGWHKFFGLRKKINAELQHTVAEVHTATKLLKEELDSQLLALENIKKDRVLNKKEEEIFNELQKNVDEVDSFIEKKLKKLM